MTNKTNSFIILPHNDAKDKQREKKLKYSFIHEFRAVEREEKCKNIQLNR